MLYLIAAEGFIQFSNASFFLLLNFYLLQESFNDVEIANFIRTRFLGVLILAFPLGLYLKGKKLKNFFRFGALATPISGILLVLSIASHQSFFIHLCMSLWGISFVIFHIPGIPFIMQNSSGENQTKAIALYFQSFSLSIFISGLIAYFLRCNAVVNINLKTVLLFFSALGFIANYFIYKIKIEERKLEKQNILQNLKEYDYKLISKALFPAFLIALGAGLTIPFINLFFKSVHGFTDCSFSLLGSITFGLVALSVIFIPELKKKFGYNIMVTGMQTIAVLLLVGLAFTELFVEYEWIIYFAVFFYVLRQPLMNAAGPLTSELSMNYVGKKNQELISALHSSIWSGTWVISSSIFGFLRAKGIAYIYILLLTACIYIIGVWFYHLLIRSYQQNKINEELE